MISQKLYSKYLADGWRYIGECDQIVDSGLSPFPIGPGAVLSLPGTSRMAIIEADRNLEFPKAELITHNDQGPTMCTFVIHKYHGHN